MKSAGIDMASANNNVLMPRAPFTSLSTRPILATRTTRSRVGDTKYLSIRSLRSTPAITEIEDEAQQSLAIRGNKMQFIPTKG